MNVRYLEQQTFTKNFKLLITWLLREQIFNPRKIGTEGKKGLLEKLYVKVTLE